MSSANKRTSQAIRHGASSSPTPPKPGRILPLTSAGASWWKGIFFVVSVAVIWVIASFVVQEVEGKGMSPIMFTYTCNSLFVIYLPFLAASALCKRLTRTTAWWRYSIGRWWGRPPASRAKYNALDAFPSPKDADEWPDLDDSTHMHTSPSPTPAGTNGSAPKPPGHATTLQGVPFSGDGQLLSSDGNARGQVADGEAIVGDASLRLADSCHRSADASFRSAHTNLRHADASTRSGDASLRLAEREPMLMHEGADVVTQAARGEQLSARETAWVSLLICPLWFSAQLMFNYSLSMTSVTSNTILSSTSSLFTFFLSVIFLKEGLSVGKGLSVLLCMVGSAIIGLNDDMNGLHTPPPGPENADAVYNHDGAADGATNAVGLLTPPGMFDSASSGGASSLNFTSGIGAGRDNCSSASRMSTPDSGELVMTSSTTDDGGMLSSMADPDRDHYHGHHISLYGDVLVLASALVYAVYTVALRLKLGSDGRVSMPLFFGLLGLFNLLLMAPLLAADTLWWHPEGIEKLRANPHLLLLVLAKGLLDNVLGSLLWARAVLLTSPTVATVGLSVQIPLAILLDFFVHNLRATFVLLFGGALILAGFLGVNLWRSGQPVAAETSAAAGDEEALVSRAEDGLDSTAEVGIAARGDKSDAVEL
eukprot:jgi/Mesvir1/12466/Mv00618-RA.1